MLMDQILWLEQYLIFTRKMGLRLLQILRQMQMAL